MINLQEITTKTHEIMAVEPTPISIRKDLDDNVYFYERNGTQYLPDQWVFDYLAQLYNAAPALLAEIEKQQVRVNKLEARLSEFADPNNWDGVMWSPPRHCGMDYPVDYARRPLEPKP